MAKRIFRRKLSFLPKTKFRVRSVAARLEHRRIKEKKNNQNLARSLGKTIFIKIP